MNRAALAFIAAATATAAGTWALTSCNSDKLAGCTYAGVLFYQPFMQVAVNDSIVVFAATVADCPQIGRGINFSLRNSSVATLRALSDTTALVRGVAVGQAKLYMTPKDYPDNRDSLSIDVIGANP